jgi:hypothetical protein
VHDSAETAYWRSRGMILRAGGSALRRAAARLTVQQSTLRRQSNLAEVPGRTTGTLNREGRVERVRFRGAELILALLLLTATNAAFGGKKAPKFAETIDLPPGFEVGFSLSPRREKSSEHEVQQRLRNSPETLPKRNPVRTGEKIIDDRPRPRRRLVIGGVLPLD